MFTNGLLFGPMTFAAVFGYYPILKAGIYDSLGPGMLTVIVLFMVILYYLARWPGWLCPASGMLIAGLLIGRCLQVVGIFDPLLNYKIFWTIIDLILLILAVFVFIVGLVLLRDWAQGKLNPDTTSALIDLRRLCPKFKSRPGVGNFSISEKIWAFLKAALRGLGLMVMAFLTGCLLTLITCAWAENASVWFILYELTLPGQISQAAKMLLLYGMIFIWPLVVLWLSFCRIWRSDFYQSCFTAWLPKIRILGAALFIGYAIGILRVYLLFYF